MAVRAPGRSQAGPHAGDTQEPLHDPRGSLDASAARGGPLTHLLYLHGFRSSPQSTKAQQFHRWVQSHRPDLHWWCPQLPASPREALALLEHGTAGWPLAQTAVIGSSLGGYYATVLAERCPDVARVVVLNPAVEPARDLAARIGVTTAWHSDESFDFRPEFIGELQAMHPAALTRAQRYLAVIAQGDEVLDWHEMAARYADCPMQVLAGSDHALSNPQPWFNAVLDFLDLTGPVA